MPRRSPAAILASALLAGAVFALANPAQSAAVTFDLTSGTIDNGVKYDSGKIAIGAPIVVPQFPSLTVSVVFTDHQLLRLTDTGKDVMPGLEEQIFSVKFTGPGDLTLKPEDVVELNTTIEVTLTGLDAKAKENPTQDDAVCTVSQASTECTNISLGFGDLTDKSISFKDMHLVLAIDQAQIFGNMFNGMGGSVANLKFDAVEFIATGDKVEVGIPAPPTLLLLMSALVLLGSVRAVARALRPARLS